MAVSHGQTWMTALRFEQDQPEARGTIDVLHRNADGTWDTTAGLPNDDGVAHYTSALVASPQSAAADIWEVDDSASGIVRRHFTEASGWSKPSHVTHGGQKVDQIAAAWSGPPVVEYMH